MYTSLCEIVGNDSVGCIADALKFLSVENSMLTSSQDQPLSWCPPLSNRMLRGRLPHPLEASGGRWLFLFFGANWMNEACDPQGSVGPSLLGLNVR